MIVTGDIAEVDGAPNYLDERSKNLDIEIIKPLWQQERESLLQEYISTGLEVYITCVHQDFFDDSWLGVKLNAVTISVLKQHHKENGLDICGENGEYHTFTSNAPFFANTVKFPVFTSKRNGVMRYCSL